MAGARFPTYTYYHCTKNKNPKCAQKCVGEKELYRQIDDYLKHVEISERFKDWAIKYLHELHENESASRNDIIQTQQKEKKFLLLTARGPVRGTGRSSLHHPTQ